ncbi:MAG: hypothetical protein AABZ50_01655 [Pseudomonadota bacterium]
MTRHHPLRPSQFLFAAVAALLCLPLGAHAQETTVTTTLDQGTWLTIPGSGCKVLDPDTKVPEDVKLTWSGQCVNGLANGEGALNATWDNGSKWIRNEAAFSQGRRNGLWKSESWAGTKQVRSYKDGNLHGPSARLMSNGTYGEYFFVNGKRVMTWLVAYAYPDGRWCTGDCRERGVSENFTIVVRAEGKDPLTQPCGTDAKACRLKVREIVKETLRQVAERAKQPASSQPSP